MNIDGETRSVTLQEAAISVARRVPKFASPPDPVALRDVSDLASRFSTRPLPISGNAIATGGIHLDLRQLSFSAAGGDLTLSDARYANTRIGDAQLLWEANPQSAKLRSHVRTTFFGGSYVIDASLQSLDWTKTTVAANGQNIQIKRLASIFGRQLPVSGFIDGSVRFQLDRRAGIAARRRLGANA